MPEITIALMISSFVAGILMFLAPCTLPLVPAYLAFISGISQADATTKIGHQKIVRNAIAFVIGFGVIFTAFGVMAGFFGGFIGPFRDLLTQVGGIFIIIFGLMLLQVIRFAPLLKDRKLPIPKTITPGNPGSAFLIGSIFALGWTPCVGPVLASVLLLATTSTTAFSGGLLLLIFSAGLAIPFLLTAILYAQASEIIERYARISKYISYIGGAFLIFIGVLLLTDNFGLTVEYGYILFDSLGFGALFNHF